jgi:Mn2+/Fe2+ NRAMP family transporter
MRVGYYLVSFLVPLVLLGAGLLAWRGWKDWGKLRGTQAQPGWRTALFGVSLLLISMSAVLYVAYAGHNVMIGGDRNGNAMTVLCIKTGNSLSFLGILASLAGNGKGRWATFASGCFMLFLWFGQGMSL